MWGSEMNLIMETKISKPQERNHSERGRTAGLDRSIGNLHPAGGDPGTRNRARPCGYAADAQTKTR
jgi:hypothetical protein